MPGITIITGSRSSHKWYEQWMNATLDDDVSVVLVVVVVVLVVDVSRS
jgi:hypothetical protein